MSTTRKTQPEDVVVTHPNRETGAAKTTRSFVIALLAAGAVLTFVLLWGSWGHQSGAQPMQILIGVLFAYFAYLVSQWRSGVLPIAAGLAIIAGIFSGVSISAWPDRNGTGYESSPLPPDLIAVLLFAYTVLMFVIVVVAMRAFQQQWQVEVEVPRSEYRGPGHAATA